MLTFKQEQGNSNLTNNIKVFHIDRRLSAAVWEANGINMVPGVAYRDTLR